MLQKDQLGLKKWWQVGLPKKRGIHLFFGYSNTSDLLFSTPSDVIWSVLSARMNMVPSWPTSFYDERPRRRAVFLRGKWFQEASSLQFCSCEDLNWREAGRFATRFANLNKESPQAFGRLEERQSSFKFCQQKLHKRQILGVGFQYFLLIFIPICGRFPFWLIFFNRVGSTTN